MSAPSSDVRWRRSLRYGATQSLIALLAAPLLLGAGYVLPSFLSLPPPVLLWLPALPAALSLLFLSGAHDLSAAPPGGHEDAAMPRGALLVAVITTLLCAAYAWLRASRPGEDWSLLGASRPAFAMLTLWAVHELATQQSERRGAAADDGLAGWALLLGLLFAVPDLLPGAPSPRTLLGPWTTPVTLLLAAAVAYGFVRLAARLLELARSGDNPEL